MTTYNKQAVIESYDAFVGKYHKDIKILERFSEKLTTKAGVEQELHYFKVICPICTKQFEARVPNILSGKQKCCRKCADKQRKSRGKIDKGLMHEAFNKMVW